MSGEGGERRALERSISSHSSMETDAVPQRARGSNQRMPPSEHTVQLPEVPYDEVSCPRPLRSCTSIFPTLDGCHPI